MSRAEYYRQWRKDHPEKDKIYNATKTDKIRSTEELRLARNAKMRAISAKYRDAARDKAMDFLGGKCMRCGFSDRRALQFDHINGGGTQEIKKRTSGSKYNSNIINSILNNEGKFQLLCANCNWIKRYEANEVKRYRDSW